VNLILCVKFDFFNFNRTQPRRIPVERPWRARPGGAVGFLVDLTAVEEMVKMVGSNMFSTTTQRHDFFYTHVIYHWIENIEMVGTLFLDF
jgi:hypothetical protein